MEAAVPQGGAQAGLRQRGGRRGEDERAVEAEDCVLREMLLPLF